MKLLRLGIEKFLIVPEDKTGDRGPTPDTVANTFSPPQQQVAVMTK